MIVKEEIANPNVTATSDKGKDRKISRTALIDYLATVDFTNPKASPEILENIGKLLELGAAPNEAAAFTSPLASATPLMMLCHLGTPEQVEILLKAHAEVNKKTFLGESALHFAVLRKDESIIELLLSHGAMPEICPSDRHVLTPIELAFSQMHAEIKEAKKICNKLRSSSSAFSINTHKSGMLFSYVRQSNLITRDTSWRTRDVNYCLPMYRVTKGSQSFYLLGTIHVLPERLWNIRQKALCLDAGMLVLENKESLMSLKPTDTTKDLFDFEGHSYRELIDCLSSKDYQTFSKYLDHKQKSLFRNFSMFGLYLAVLRYVHHERQEGVDSFLEDTYNAVNKPVSGLETFSEAWPTAQQLKPYATLDNIKRSIQERTAYDLQTHASMKGLSEYVYLNGEKQQIFTMMGADIGKRNFIWIDRMLQYTKENENVLIAVGLGHLPGNLGLLNILQKRGYRLEKYREDESFQPYNVPDMMELTASRSSLQPF